MTSPGASVAFESRGEGRCVVLLSGLAAGGLVWRDVAPRLEAQFRVVQIHQRGFGASPATDEPQTLQLHAEDVVSVLNALDISSAAIVGLSMGAGVAQVLALEHAHRVDALALLSASSEHSPTTRDMFLARADQAEAMGMQAVAGDMITSWFSPAYRQSHPDVVATLQASILRLDPIVFANRCRSTAERNLTRRLSGIECPLLFIGGALDPMNALEHLTRYLRELPRVEAWIGGNAGHIVTLEAPERVSALLISFLREAERREA